ncbi:hypothetical protein [Polyangium sp. 6x1]|uniref:hypothetical protein n=1 Tax=Polyangium sp. 6x1 TaxID=3042689 RepID=UPI002482F65A|nr:hypothetical protein [Polyangium sp. 6x1]MDI1447891.1 hypothetical protein [Polyangium sp. 6x1]
MMYRLGFVSIAIVSLGLTACALGSYQPPSGNGGEGGENTGEGGSGGKGGGSASSSSVGSGGTGGQGGGSSGSTASSGGTGGAPPIMCNGEEPKCAISCQATASGEPICTSSGWKCPPGTVDLATCPGLNGCCEKTLDCPLTFTCVATRCKPKPLDPGKCWSDLDCVQGVCEGASICPCNVACFGEDMEGTCK